MVCSLLSLILFRKEFFQKEATQNFVIKYRLYELMNLKYSKNINMRKIQIHRIQEDLFNVSKYVCINVCMGTYT